MKKITASLVVYNPNIERVLETLDSLFVDQPDCFLTVIDNSTKPNDCEKALKRYRNINYIRSGSNIGFGAGHNIALSKSLPSQYHLFLNPDITVKPGCLDTLIKVLDEKPDIGLVGPRTLNPDGTLQYSCKRNPTFLVLFIRRILRPFIQKIKVLRDYNAKYEMQDFDYNTSFRPYFLSGCFMLFRRSVLDKLQGFDRNFFLYFEDADLTRRTNQVSSTCYVPQAVIIHDWMRGSHKSLYLAYVMFKSSLVYFKKMGNKNLEFLTFSRNRL